MKRTSWFAGAIVAAGYVIGCTSENTGEDESLVNEGAALECEVAIVGGGAGGLHTAYRLAPSLGAKVCVFEKEKELGGRIHDVNVDDSTAPDAPRVGVGARRVMEGQTVLFKLADELGIQFDTPPLAQDLIEARKAFSFSKDDLASKVYPTIPASTIADKDRETVIYDLLRTSPERATLPNPKYPDFVTYIKKVAGEEQYQFLRDMSRFRADFEYPLDARGYLDYLDEEWDVCCKASYPKGGMSSFIRGMAERSTAAGARIFTEEPVTSIAKYGGGYTLTTSKRSVKARKVVINVPPNGLDKIGGDVAARIKAQPQFQQLIGVKVVTVTQWWPESWWKEIKNPAATASEGSAVNVWRAWSTEHCLSFIEIPQEQFQQAQKVTRSVYVDNLKCADTWEDLSKQGTAAVEAELSRELTALFSNGVSTPATVTVPKPLKTRVQVWPAAWYWLRAGATITNAQLTDWAVEPLAGEAVGLVGEAYNVQRSGWSDAAYKSSIKLLNAKYGMTLPGLSTKSIPQVSLGTRSWFGGLSGH